MEALVQTVRTRNREDINPKILYFFFVDESRWSEIPGRGRGREVLRDDTAYAKFD